ncbi:MAG: hypothetical protein GF308_11730 [Candidatus Heimdallarchaeota archaeon]|nr:hypothetical protein [Candidatus Heimdallarchaeota archaeon]
MNQTTLTGEIIEPKAEQAYAYVLPFSYDDYQKFSDRKFTSIRKKKIPKKFIGKTWLLTVKRQPREEPSFTFFATCLSIERKKLEDIPTEVLIKDTQRTSSTISSRAEAIAMVQQFYRKKIDEETAFSLIFLKRNFWR